MIPITKLSGRLGNQMFQLAYLYAQAGKGEIPDIYVQDEDYFKPVARAIRDLFRQGAHERIDKVAIHIRRGDYVGNLFYVDLTSTDYYQDAMSRFPGEKFFVFSDDIEWCKKWYPLLRIEGVEFSEGCSELEDLNKMMACKAVIIANSSFSWWGGYLSEGTVIAPKQWYADGVERTKLPDSWIKV